MYIFNIYVHIIYRKDIMETFQKTTLIFTIIGAINWGLIGLFDFNLVESLFGVNSVIPSIIYAIVGICGLVNIGVLFSHFGD